MQDGKDIDGGKAGEWLRDRYSDGPEPESELIIRSDAKLDSEAHKRLLEFLFGPLPS